MLKNIPMIDIRNLWRNPKTRMYQSDIQQFIPYTKPGVRFYNVQLVMIGSGYQEFLPANPARRYLQFQLWDFVGEFIGVIFENGPPNKIALPTAAGYTALINRAINLNSLQPITFQNPPTDPVTIILKGTPGEFVRGMITEGK